VLTCVYAFHNGRPSTHFNRAPSEVDNDPFLPGGVEGSGFLPASTLDVMEADHDLRKSITGIAVAQRGAMLSSGRDASAGRGRGLLTSQRGAIGSNRQVRAGAAVDRRITDVGRLTPGAGSESSTQMGSDQTAAEALQEAETEVGVGLRVGLGVFTAARAAGVTHLSTLPTSGLGLTA
jgi:hypothetical protein